MICPICKLAWKLINSYFGFEEWYQECNCNAQGVVIEMEEKKDVQYA